MQTIDSPALLHAATSHDVVIKLQLRPGEFGVKRTTLARVWPNRGRDQSLSETVNDTVITGVRRTPRQDIVCAVDELVEVAVRALSPGINDPFTAIACIDRLSACSR